MKFISLKMKNWLIFKGEQEILFPQNDNANILLIFGENMTGKSSLQNAVRWALYGEAVDRQKRVLNNSTLMNKNAEDEGEKTFSVKLKIESEGQLYEIFREANIGVNEVKVSVILKEDNRVKDGSDVENIIEGLVPKQISQFLLFDGELLNEFETLVADQLGPQATAIKRSIEKALGLPVLQRASDELDNLQRSMSKVFQKQMKKNNNLNALIRNLELHENNLKSKDTEAKDIEEKIEETQIKISELNDELEKSTKNIEFSEKKKILNDELNRNKEQIIIEEENIKSSMADVWQEPLMDALSPQIDKIKSEITLLSSKRAANEGSLAQIKELTDAIEDKLCSVCDSRLNDEKLSKIKDKLNIIKNSSYNTDELNQEITSLNQKLKGLTLSGYNKNASMTAQTCSNEKDRLIKRNIRIDNELFEIRNELTDFDEERGRKNKNEHDACLREVGRLLEQSVKVDEEKEKIEIEINSIKKNPDYINAKNDGDTENNLETAENLSQIFKSAVSEYRESMREKVGARASDTFKNLTTEKKFDYLEINKSYGLNLIIEGSQVSRSAGAEQIVALSLIEALNYHGRRKGPMLMDTPAGRLDKSHRKNIMNYLPQVVTQLAFFAHSGELTDDDIYFDRSKIGKKYTINRVNSYHAILEDF